MATLFISFPSSSFRDISEAFHFCNRIAPFKKAGILWTGRKGILNDDPEKIADRLQHARQRNFTIVERASRFMDNGSRLTFRYEPLKELHLLVLSLEAGIETSLAHHLVSEAEAFGFSFAYVVDLNKARWQNETMISNYQVQGRSYVNLPRVWDPILSPVVGKELIDVSGNPGHRTETHEISFMAAPEMWFGPKAWTCFDLEAVLSFPAAISISETGRNTVHVRLFDTRETNYETRQILELQAQFRQHTGMDAVEQRLKDVVYERWRAIQALEPAVVVPEEHTDFRQYWHANDGE